MEKWKEVEEDLKMRGKSANGGREDRRRIEEDGEGREVREDSDRNFG